MKPHFRSRLGRIAILGFMVLSGGVERAHAAPEDALLRLLINAERGTLTELADRLGGDSRWQKFVSKVAGRELESALNVQDYRRIFRSLGAAEVKVLERELREFVTHSPPAAFESMRDQFANLPNPTVTTAVPFRLEGLEVATIEDPTRSTGATLFHFPKGAVVSYDARGGSVASAETHLLDPGSYSSEVDGIVFAGGSTLGLEAASGVRREIFRSRSTDAGAFDAIPSVPSAVVYDFGGRVHAEADALIYPTVELGAGLMKNLGRVFPMGRAGAGISTTANKISEEAGTVFGGQGAAFREYKWGKVFVAVVVNPVGDIKVAGKSITGKFTRIDRGQPSKPGQNTTLSIIVTDLPLDRNQLKRLSVMVHTSMAETIQPFHTYHDGDINFAVSLNPTSRSPQSPLSEEVEFALNQEASALMKKAIVEAVRTANGSGTRPLVPPQGPRRRTR